MANAYYSTQWTGLDDGTVVAVAGGTAIIGTDAFSDYSLAKAAGDVVLCDVFASNEWAGTVESTVDVVLEGDTYTLTVGEQAFATLEAAAMQVASNQYGGVETYGDNYEVTAYVYVSGAWTDLPDYTVVATGNTVWDEDGAVVTGGTAVIGVTAFATYEKADDKLDTYWGESQLNGVAASSDIYLDSTWISASYSEGETITVTLADGSEVTATFGENAILLSDDTATGHQAGVTEAATKARANNSAIYFTGGTFLFSGSQYTGSMFTDGCTAVIGGAYVQRITNGKSSGKPLATPETYVLAGARVAMLYMGQGTNDTGYAYVGTGGYVGTISPAYSGSFKTVNVEIDGGTFGSYSGTGATISDELNVTVKDAKEGSVSTSVQSGVGFTNVLTCDVNYTVINSKLSNIMVAGRSIEEDKWYLVYNTEIDDFTIDLTDSTVATVKSGNNLAYWCFNEYNVVLDHATVTTLSPSSGGYGSLAYVGGSATVVGGTFCTPTGSAITYGDENVESVWSDGDFRYLMLSKSTKTVNADGSITIVGGIYYNGAAAAGSQWIAGGTATLAGGTQNKFSLAVEGNTTSYVKTLSGIETITIDATALFTTASNIASGVAITVDATDFVLEGASKAVLTTTGSISTTNLTVLENGTVSENYVLSITGGTALSIIEKPTIYSYKWADLADGTVVTYNGANYVIGTQAFGNYATAKATGKSITICDKYYSKEWASASGTVYVVLDGETVGVTIGTEAFTSQSAAFSAAGTDAAVVEQNGSYYWKSGGGRIELIEGANEYYVLSNVTDTTTVQNSGLGVGNVTYDNATVRITDNSKLVHFNYYGFTNKDVTATIIVSGATVSDTLGSSILQSTGGYTVDAETGRILWSGKHATMNFVLESDAKVSTVQFGEVGSASTGEFNLTLNGAYLNTLRVEGQQTSGATYGNEIINLNGGTIMTVTHATATTGAHFVDIRALSGASYIKSLGLNSAKVTGAAITVNAGDDASLALGCAMSNFPTLTSITIDVDNFQFGASESVTVLTATSGLSSYTINVTGTAIDDYSLSVTDKTVSLVKKNAYFSESWIGLTDGTVVATPGGTATIGYDAFGLYADAVSEAAKHSWNVKSADRYYSAEWSDLGEGDEVTIVNPSGTFTTTIGDADIPAYSTLDGAKTAAKTENTTLAIVGGTWTMTGRNNWYGIKNTVMTNSKITGSTNGGIVTMLNGGGTYTDYEAAFLVGENAYLSSLAAIGNNAGCVVKEITYNVNDGGRVGTLYLVGYAGVYTGALSVNLDGGTINTSYIGAGGGTVSGTVNVAMKDAKIGSFYLAPQYSSTSALADGASINLTLDNSTMLIRDFDSAHTFTKGEGATINITVGGTATSTIDFNTTKVDTLTIDVGATLAIGANWKYANTITVDAETCDYSQGEYLILSGYSGSTETITVVNDDPTQNYKIVKVGTNVFYQGPVTYFSVTWAGFESGTKVTVAGEEYTIGTDAFASYDLAKSAGAKLIKSADVYLNTNYNATDPIVIGDYTATFGVDAFASSATAISTAKSMGGALDVTGGTFGGLTVSGIDTSFFTNVSTGTNASIWGQTENAVIAKKEMTANNVDCNYFAAVTAGTVTGDVTVNATDLTTYYSLYLAQKTIIDGNATATVSGNSYLTKGLCAVDSDATVNGNVEITLAGGSIFRKGVQIDGTVNGTATVNVTGDVVVSSITETFDTVTISEGATLHYGRGLEGDWKQEYLFGIKNLVNNGTLYYNAEIDQNTYLTVAESVSGTGTIGTELSSNKIFTKDGTTYAAAIQSDVLVNSDWEGREFLDIITIDDVNYIYGISAFATQGAAEAADFTDEKTNYLTFGEYTEGKKYGTDGKIGLAGGTVTDNAFAGGALDVTGGTTSDWSWLSILGVSEDPGSFSSLIGGAEISGDTTLAGVQSSVKISGESITGKAIVGSSYINSGVAVTADDVYSTVSVAGGSFSSLLVGGALLNGADASITGTIHTEVSLSDGTVKMLGGGCYIQGGTAGSGQIDLINSTSAVTVSGGTVLGNVYGGNYANRSTYSTSEASAFGGDIAVTIDATEKVYIGGYIVAGSYGKGVVSGNTTLTFKGSGANLTVNGSITGDSSSGDDSDSGRYVSGTRTLAFETFSGDLGKNGQKIAGFDTVTLSGSTVSFQSFGTLTGVAAWNFTDSTLTWTSGRNSFSGDLLTLTSSKAIGDDGWTVFQLADGLTTGWEEFATDTSGTAKINLSVGGVSGTLIWDGTEMYTGTVGTTNYKFYLENNALKVGKLA